MRTIFLWPVAERETGRRPFRSPNRHPPPVPYAPRPPAGAVRGSVRVTRPGLLPQRHPASAWPSAQPPVPGLLAITI